MLEHGVVEDEIVFGPQPRQVAVQVSGAHIAGRRLRVVALRLNAVQEGAERDTLGCKIKARQFRVVEEATLDLRWARIGEYWPAV